jgi:hypothetical protein
MTEEWRPVGGVDPTDADEVDCLVSMRVEQQPNPVEGAMKWMGTCGHEVWLSLTSQKFLVQYGDGVDVLCMECALELANSQEQE